MINKTTLIITYAMLFAVAPVLAMEREDIPKNLKYNGERNVAKIILFERRSNNGRFPLIYSKAVFPSIDNTSKNSFSFSTKAPENEKMRRVAIPEEDREVWEALKKHVSSSLKEEKKEF